MKRIFYVLVLCLLAHFSICAGALSMKAISVAISEIKKVKPDITNEILDQDIEIIEENFSQIQKVFEKKELTENDVKKAVLLGWKYVRLKSPLPAYKTMHTSSFIKFMSAEFFVHYGKVIFKSAPTEAGITVGIYYVGKAETSEWYSVGETLSVTCSKEGFENGQTIYQVAQGKNTCLCNLKPKQ